MGLGLKFKANQPPRKFNVGGEFPIQLSDCGKVLLETNELFTLEHESGSRYDVVCKDWGFYATPSLNGRLLKFNLRAVLVRNKGGHYFILMVVEGKEAEFQKYLDLSGNEIVAWMDSDITLASAINNKEDI